MRRCAQRMLLHMADVLGKKVRWVQQPPPGATGTAGQSPAVPIGHRENSTSPRAMSARTTVSDTVSPGCVPAATGAVAVTAGSAIWI